MGDVSREMRIPRTKRNTRDEIHCTERKNASNGLVNRLDMAEERISELDDISIETSRNEKQTENTGEKKKHTKTITQNTIFKTAG